MSLIKYILILCIATITIPKIPHKTPKIPRKTLRFTSSYHSFNCRETALNTTWQCNTKFQYNKTAYCYDFTFYECKFDDPYNDHNSSDCIYNNLGENENTRVICPARLQMHQIVPGCHIYQNIGVHYVKGVYNGHDHAVRINGGLDYLGCIITYQELWKIYYHCTGGNYELNCYNYQEDQPYLVTCELISLDQWELHPDISNLC